MDLKSVLHDELISYGTAFPWSMQLEDRWAKDEKEHVWAIRDGNGNIISWVRKESIEAVLWNYIISEFNSLKISGYIYEQATSYPLAEIP